VPGVRGGVVIPIRMLAVYVQATVTREVNGRAVVCQIPTFIVDGTDSYNRYLLDSRATKAEAHQYAAQRALDVARRVLDPQRGALCVSVSAVTPEPYACVASFTWRTDV
jgi:hypothetical protein